MSASIKVHPEEQQLPAYTSSSTTTGLKPATLTLKGPPTDVITTALRSYTTTTGQELMSSAFKIVPPHDERTIEHLWKDERISPLWLRFLNSKTERLYSMLEAKQFLNRTRAISVFIVLLQWLLVVAAMPVTSSEWAAPATLPVFLSALANVVGVIISFMIPTKLMLRIFTYYFFIQICISSGFGLRIDYFYYSWVAPTIFQTFISSTWFYTIALQIGGLRHGWILSTTTLIIMLSCIFANLAAARPDLPLYTFLPALGTYASLAATLIISERKRDHSLRKMHVLYVYLSKQLEVPLDTLRKAEPELLLAKSRMALKKSHEKQKMKIKERIAEGWRTFLCTFKNHIHDHEFMEWNHKRFLVTTRLSFIVEFIFSLYHGFVDVDTSPRSPSLCRTNNPYGEFLYAFRLGYFPIITFICLLSTFLKLPPRRMQALVVFECLIIGIPYMHIYATIGLKTPGIMIDETIKIFAYGIFHIIFMIGVGSSMHVPYFLTTAYLSFAYFLALIVISGVSIIVHLQTLMILLFIIFACTGLIRQHENDDRKYFALVKLTKLLLCDNGEEVKKEEKAIMSEEAQTVINIQASSVLAVDEGESKE
ncbi:hypothetical protein HDV05_003164 [Chytridiales sp. JEL 0842]|nr:hypothetical protein HDV05_003164 [Chytridiales sp. JEL 0842]